MSTHKCLRKRTQKLLPPLADAFCAKMSATLFFFSFLLIHGFLSTLPAAATQPTAVRFELIHRHSIPELSDATTHEERIRELVQLDAKRYVDMVSKTAGGQRIVDVISSTVGSDTTVGKVIKGSGISAVMPMKSGVSFQSGLYFVTLGVGTPPQKIMVAADTGSDLLWLNCRYGQIKIRGYKASFLADKSSSYRPVSCDDPLCNVLPDVLKGCGPKKMCKYNITYQDQTAAQGVFGKEKVTVELESGRTVELDDVVMGCTSSVSANNSVAKADGILGLGYSNSSLIAMAKDKFGGVFSYCIVNHFSDKQVPSSLSLGRRLKNFKEKQRMRYTAIIVDKRTLGSYYVNVGGISVGGVMLDIPAYIWDLNAEAGAIVDSGATLTSLPAPAYYAVMNALKTRALQKLATKGVHEFEFCFKEEGYNETMVPKLVFHFSDKTQFEPAVSGYVIPAAPKVMCLAFMSTPWPSPALIGNVIAQGFMWEYDITNMKLGFAPSTCA